MPKSMHKVLFADDEYWTREKLRTMICWEEYGLEFLEPAVDGEDALMKIGQFHPDIFITDINMPFLSGVELLEKVQKKYPKLVTFVISGYDDFSYVKDSFMSGSINYLIKPVSKIDLVKAIVKALEKISEYETEQIELLKSASVLQDREFSQLIQRKGAWSAAGICADHAVTFAGMRLVLIKIHNFQEIVKKDSFAGNNGIYLIKNEIRKIFDEEDAVVFNNIYRHNEYLVLTKKTEDVLINLAEKIRVKFSAAYHSCMTICITSQSYAMESMPMAYLEAISLLMTRIYKEKDQIIVSRDKEKGGWIQHFTPELEKQLKSALALGKMQNVKRVVFENTGLRACEKEAWTYLEVKQTIKQIFDVIAGYALQQGKSRAADIDGLFDVIDQTVDSLNCHTLFDWMEDAIAYLVPLKEEIVTESMKQTVHLVAEWIDQHYAEELSLTALAEMYYVESSYLSKVFRQEMGETLILYITHKRIQKALEYMADDTMRLSEVAFVVGYDDYTYFSRVFKKIMGMSPREYRAQTGEEC